VRRTGGSLVKRDVRKRLSQTTWAIPLVYATCAIVAGLVLPRLEHRYLADVVSGLSAPAAMSISSAIASGMIALTGIVFSLAFVMVQFSATAYSPRLVLWVARDRVMSHALGVFSATFLYALMFMAWVDRDASGRVPLISAWMTMALLVTSMGMFIALLHRISMLQITRMLIFTATQGCQAIAELYPDDAAIAADTKSPADQDLPVTQTLRHSGRPQVVQALDIRALVDMATSSGASIEVATAVGDTVMELTPLFRVHGARQPLDEQALMNALELGDERTFEQDPKYALRILVDIAIKALSPAINDPTTAVQALDQIEDMLLRLGRHRLEIGPYRDANGVRRLTIHHPTWDDFLLLALDEIRSCGASSVQVMRRMNALIANLMLVLPAERQAALRDWERRLRGTVERTFASAEERQNASVADRQGLGLGPEKPGG
jgi:uncharacterized membrane protein